MLTVPRLNLALFLARVPLGAYFALGGYTKIIGVGVANFATTNLDRVPTWMPPEFGRPFLTSLPFVELASGLFLIVGLLVRTFSFLQALLLTSFIIAMKFGHNIAHVPGAKGQGPAFDTNIVLLGLALCLTLLGAGEWHATRMFRRRRRVVVATTTAEPALATTRRGTPIV